MTPPMSWARCWRIIRWVQRYGMPTHAGQQAYLESEIRRMDRYQRSRYLQEVRGYYPYTRVMA